MLRGPGVESITINGKPFYNSAPPNRLTEPPAVEQSGKPKFVTFERIDDGWLIPVRLESEANLGGKRSAAISRKSAVKRSVWEHLGPDWRIWGPVGDAVRAGQPAEIRIVRVGGRVLDTGNLWRAVKPVEDALAILLGCDDGWPAWKRSFVVDQEPGERWGVRIIVRAAQ